MTPYLYDIKNIGTISSGNDWVHVRAPNHYQNQCWLIYKTIRNWYQWNLYANLKFSIQQNAFENVACKRWPFCAGLNDYMILLSDL